MTDQPPTLTPAQLAEIEARTRAATPGPATVEDNRSMNGAYWLNVPHPDCEFVSIAEFRPGCGEAEEIGAGGKADAEFYSHARTDIPALLSHLRALELENARLREIIVAAAIPLETLYGQIMIKPYKELSAELQARIATVVPVIRAALQPGEEPK